MTSLVVTCPPAVSPLSSVQLQTRVVVIPASPPPPLVTTMELDSNLNWILSRTAIVQCVNVSPYSGEEV